MSPSVLLPELLGGGGYAVIFTVTVGVFGMGIVDSIQNITDEDESSDAPPEDTADGLDDGTDEPIGDGGDLEALADDESALDLDDGSDGGEMGDLADMGGGGSTAELENRVDTLEEEIERLNSTMSTVRSENEEISDAVDDVQENVRQLLEIYEMVTRGVNPFVDEAPDGAFGGQDAASGSIGVFDDEGDDASTTEENLDEEVVDADAEAFFDEALDEEPDDSLDDEPDDAPDDAEGSADGVDDGQTAGEGTSEEDSKSFEELKDEYDSDESDLTGTVVDDDSSEGATVDSSEAGGEDTTADIRDSTAEGANSSDGGGGAPSDDGSPESGGETTDGDGPYLERMPTGYAGDLIVLEWLTDLVSEAGPQETRGALSYYASVGWISDAVERELRTVVDGIADTEAAQREGDGEIGVEEHRRSIATIDRLAGTSNQFVHGD
jgi:archaellum component FlaD/FlaE